MEHDIDNFGENSISFNEVKVAQNWPFIANLLHP